MSLIEQIRGEVNSARRDQRKADLSLFTTLLGESEMVGKSNGNRATTDAEVIAVIKKFIKNIDENLKYSQLGTTDNAVAVHEKYLLSEFLPKQLTAEETHNVVSAFVMTSGKDKGALMKYMKTNYEGQYDSKAVMAVLETL